MNPFLAGLVERATLRAPVLERRPRSVFEPFAGAVSGPVAVDGAEQAELGDPDGFVGRPRPPAEQDDSSVRSGGEPTTSGAPSARLSRLERLTAETPHHLDSSAALASSLVRHAGDEQRLVVSTASQRGKLEPIARLETAVAAALLVERPLREGRSQTPMLARGATPPSPLAHMDDIAQNPPRARSAQPAAAASSTAVPAPTTIGGPPAGTNAALLRSGPRVPGPSALIVRSQAGPHTPRPTGLVATPPAPVHVTIGRIEVRANPPAEGRSPVRRPPAGPRMSLEDYLNGRRGGSR